MSSRAVFAGSASSHPPAAARKDPGAGSGTPRAPLPPRSAPTLAYLEVRDDFERATEQARRALPLTVDCGRCTSACCCTHDMAHVTPSDAAAIVELIDLTPELARDVAGVVFRQLEDVSARVAAGRLVAELGTFPCPLLSFDRRCRIYDFRPWACIATQSADRRACEGSAAAGKRDAWDPQEYFPVLAETYRRLSPRSLRALQHAIDQKHSGNTLPMTMALAMVLDAPAALGAALGGRKP